MTEKQLDRVLDWVNRQRVKMGYKPIKALKKGVPSEPSSCSLARSLLAGNAEVSVTHDLLRAWKTVTLKDRMAIRVEARGKGLTRWWEIPGVAPDFRVEKIPRYIQQFIKDFDDLEIPELIKPDYIKQFIRPFNADEVPEADKEEVKN